MISDRRRVPHRLISVNYREGERGSLPLSRTLTRSDDLIQCTMQVSGAEDADVVLEVREGLRINQ